jgi:adenylate cyclase
MAREIERKFLVKRDFSGDVKGGASIIQAYLSSVPGRTVRIRISGEKGYLTVKGEAESGGIERYEWEKEIPVNEAEELLNLCEPGIIKKTRHKIKAGDHIFEVDVFHGENQGLIIAEVELTSVDEPFERPDWLGEEVTGDDRYYNSRLAKNPFRKWM